MISVGGGLLEERAAEVAARSGWRHVHVTCPSSFVGQLARSLALLVRPPDNLRLAIAGTQALVVFNDTHPCTVQIRGRCRQAPVSLVEEGTGLHRTRPFEHGRRWLARVFAPALNASGRQGEARWVDELWVSHVGSLTPAQRLKRIETFDRTAVVAEIRRGWSTVPAMPEDARPVLLLLGQPFVEDQVMTRSQAGAMFDAVAAALPKGIDGRMVLAYKPHPREQRPGPTSASVLGPSAIVLDQHVPLEAMDFGERRLFVLSFTSGAMRGLAGAWHCVSVAGCFPALAREIGETSMFPGLNFLGDLGQLPRELEAFLARATRENHT